MEWLTNLICPGSESLASTLVLYSFVIAAGVYLGKIKVAGISLGVTFVLFVGILMGHFGYIVNAEVLKFIREFGLILFIFSIGIQVGPGFFSSFKKRRSQTQHARCARNSAQRGNSADYIPY